MIAEHQGIFDIQKQRDHWLRDLEAKFQSVNRELKNHLTVLELSIGSVLSEEKGKWCRQALADTRRLIDDHLTIMPPTGTHTPQSFSLSGALDSLREELNRLLLKKVPVWQIETNHGLYLEGDPDQFRYVFLGLTHQVMGRRLQNGEISISHDDHYLKIDFREGLTSDMGDNKPLLEDAMLRLLHAIVQINGGAFHFLRKNEHFLATCLWPLSPSKSTITGLDLRGTNENHIER
jgi:hypothetical protein